MRNTIWQATIDTVGKEAPLFLAENRIILFAGQAPQAIADYCVTHGQGILHKPLAAGQCLELFGIVYAISAVGDIASRNLTQLGHITLLFDGAAAAEFPGTIHLRGNTPERLLEYGNITIFEPN